MTYSASHPSVVTCVQEVGDEDVDAVEYSLEIGPETSSVRRSSAPCEASQQEVV